MTFDDARMECVANNGDLPSIENNQDLEDVITNITTDTITVANGTRLDVQLPPSRSDVLSPEPSCAESI